MAVFRDKIALLDTTTWPYAGLLLLATMLPVASIGPAKAASKDIQNDNSLTSEKLKVSSSGDIPLANQKAESAYQYMKKGQYLKAELLYAQALDILEKTLRPGHPDLGVILKNLALLNSVQGRPEKAEMLYKRALPIMLKTIGPDHPAVLDSLYDLAKLYVAQGRYDEAEPLYQQVLLTQEKELGPDHPSLVPHIDNLAEVYRAQARYVQAETLCQRVLAIREKTLPPDHPTIATSLHNVASLYVSQGRYAEAEPLYQRAVAIYGKSLPPDNPSLANTYNGLATLYRSQGRNAKAEPLFQRSLAIMERKLPPDHPDLAPYLSNLAGLYRAQGRYNEAERLYQRALAIREKALGLDHPKLATSLNNLAVLYQTQGRWDLAEPLYRRALVIMETTLPPDHPNLAISLSNLAAVYEAQGRHAESELFYVRSLAIMENVARQSDLATTINNLASLYKTQGRYAEAELLFEQALTIREKALGQNHPDVAESLNDIGALYREQNLYSKATPLYERSRVIFEKVLGSDHPNLAVSLNGLASLYRSQGQDAQGLVYARQSSAIYRKRILANGAGDSALREAQQNRTGFFTHLALLDATRDPAQPQLIADEAFQVAQLAQASNTAAALAKMAARFASGKDALGELARRRQDTAEQLIGLEKQWVSQISKPAAQRQADRERELQEALAKSKQTLVQIDNELNQRFPEYQLLTRPEPISVAQVQALLKPQEAMVMFSVGADVSYGWVIKADRVAFYPLTISRKELADKVTQVRNNMRFDSLQRGPRFDLMLLHDLYQRLFGPMAADLAGVEELVLVPSGPLQSFAFASLITSPPPAIQTDADYRQVDWLAKHVALSVLPSANAIRALREFTKASHAKLPLIGFGDPVLRGKKSADSSTTRGKVDIGGIFRGAPANLQGSHADIANVDAIRQYDPLPETDVELEKLATTLKADKRRALKLRNEATESQVKQTDLSRYRHLAFATHGAMAGEIPGADEPGLILTPPKVGSELDDGYLSAGEIAKLKLNADWVILSACNTAAADGTPGAEGLSGLARAFFYAGARSLLVSQWSVDSESSMKLTTGLFETLQMEPTLSRAKAQQKSMLNLMNDTANAKFAHPAHWAPFMVVGEGGNVQVSNKALSPTRPLESRIRD